MDNLIGENETERLAVRQILFMLANRLIYPRDDRFQLPTLLVDTALPFEEQIGISLSLFTLSARLNTFPRTRSGHGSGVFTKRPLSFRRSESVYSVGVHGAELVQTFNVVFLHEHPREKEKATEDISPAASV